MKTLYIECNMGAAGDMLLASLAELTGDVKACADKLNSLGIPDVTYIFEPAVKCGITGTHARVIALGTEEDEHLHEHGHEHFHEHEHISDDSESELDILPDHGPDHGQDHEFGHHHHHTHLSDIEKIIESFRNFYAGAFHERIKYPENVN